MTTILDLILAGMVLEGAGLLGWYRWTRQGVPPGALLPNLAAGAMLLLAMRLALAGWPWWTASLCLLGGLLAHLVDLRHRWAFPAPLR